MELLSNGVVMAEGPGVSKNWYALTPSSSGSYVKGTWSSLASMSLQRLYDATNVLDDGRVFIVGGEYSGPGGANNWTNTGEIYDPVANSWSSIPNFPQSQFGDDPSMLLPNGNVLVGYLSGPQTYIYNTTSNTWSQGATKLNSDASDEETWVKLPDDSVLTYDVFSSGNAQRYVPSSNQWVATGHVPVSLTSSAVGYELGPAFLLPDGRVFYLGANGNTAYYTPSSNSWAAGPVIPNHRGADDAPGAMMPNGDILFAADSPLFNAPTHIYEFNPTTGVYTDVTPSAAGLSSTPAYETRMLVLPSGQVLFNTGGNKLWVYTPSGSPQSSWQPTITSIAANGSNYTLTGTQINGLSAGASYGDDAEMDSNYPIIELSNGSGTTYFARTFDWSSTGVATGSASVSTSFSIPSGVPNGTYSVSVIANGIASAPYSFTYGQSSGSADLSVNNSGTATETEGDSLTYSLTVTNGGPNDATATVLTDTLGAGMQYQSATTSQGTISEANGVVTISLGTVPNGQTATATVTVLAIGYGNLTDLASVTSSVSDLNTGNNSASATTAVAAAPIVVSAPIAITPSRRVSNLQVATFTCAGGVVPTSSFVVTIDWGDGKTSGGTIGLSGTTYTVTGSHAYSRSGTYTVSTTVTQNQVTSIATAGIASGVPGAGAAGVFSPMPFAMATGAAADQAATPSVLGTTNGSGADDDAGSDADSGKDVVALTFRLATSARRKIAVPQGPRVLGRS